MLKSIAIGAFILLGNLVYSQDIPLSTNIDNGTNFNILYKHDMSGKVFANTRGYGFTFHRGKHVTANSRSFYEAEIQTLRHPKEIKLLGTAEDHKRFVYGKINSVFVLRGALGMQNVLFTKGNDAKAVEVRYSYSIGPAFAFAKPYYLRVYKNKGVGTLVKNEYIRFDAENFTTDSGVVTGRGPYSMGLSEMRIYPGVNAKFNLSFEYAPYTNLIRAVETGLSLDYYPKALPIMARNPSENIILTIYVGFVFGTKWY